MFCKYNNFISLEQFIEYTLFEIIVKIESDNEVFKERLQMLETELNWLAPHSMMGGKYKPITLVKKEKVANGSLDENLDILEEVNNLLMN